MKQHLNKNVIIIGLISLLFLISLSENTISEVPRSSGASIELEDQHNSPEHIDASYGMPLYQGWCSAQRFIPTKQSLSKVSLIKNMLI